MDTTQRDAAPARWRGLSIWRQPDGNIDDTWASASAEPQTSAHLRGDDAMMTLSPAPAIAPPTTPTPVKPPAPKPFEPSFNPDPAPAINPEPQN